MGIASHLSEQLLACYRTFQSGDIASAEAQYLSLLQQSTMGTLFYGDVQHLGAMIATKSWKHDIAISRIEQAILSVPQHHEYQNTRGNIFTEMQDFPKAIAAFEKSLSFKPDYLASAQNLGRLLIQSNDPVSAIDIYAKGLLHHPQDKQLLLGHVIAHKEALHFEKAWKLLEAVHADDKTQFLCGQILFHLGRHAESIAAYETAIRQKENAAAALKNLLQIYWMRGEWDKAEILIDSLLPTATADLYIPISRSYMHAEDKDKAHKIVDMGLEKFGKHPYLIAERARLKLNEGEFDTAWDDALAALSLQQGDLYLMECFADCALVSGHLDDAMVAAHEALKVIPNNQYWIAVKYTAGRARGQDYRYYANYEQFVRPYELVPPEGYGSLAEYNEILKKTLDEMHEFSEHPLDQSLRHGIQTPVDLRLVDHPVLKAHFKALDAPIRAYMQEIGNADPNHPLLRRNTGNYKITGSWSVRLRKQGFHVNHVHPEGWISSAYYVDVPDEVNTTKDNAGWIHFGEPPYPVKDKNGDVLGWEKIVKPKAGTLVLFPSYLWHGTVPLQTDTSRITLPIDVVPA